MRYIKYCAIALLILSACTPATQLQVTRLGFEPAEIEEQVMYALPQTMLKINIQYERVVILPGPYGQYGEKYLGLQNCVTQRSEKWNLVNTSIAGVEEVDPDHYYVINALTGNVPHETFNQLLTDGLITVGILPVSEDISMPVRASGSVEKSMIFGDVTVKSYVSEKQETMYKTIVTDTSFVKVPVNRTVLEKKTHEQKANEAADFILELRLSRFELLSGYGEVFPDGEAMDATLKKIDQLEDEYLSLFTGKQYTESYSREFYITPRQEEGSNQYRLAYFSEELGFVPAAHEAGSPLTVRIVPSGKTRSLRNLMPQSPEDEVYNQIYYRLPDVADVKLLLDEKQIHWKRMNIYQLGAMVTQPISIPKKTPLRK